MKNKSKLFGFIALVAIIVFSITACPPEGGGGNYANVKVRANNNGGTPPTLSVSFARAIGSNSEIENDTASFSSLSAFYTNCASNSLGAKKGASITPTSFKLAVTSIAFFDAYGNEHNDVSPAHCIDVPGGLLDFANGAVTITIDDDIPIGTTCAAIRLDFSAGAVSGSSNGSNGWATVTFDWPGGQSGFTGHSKNSTFYGMTQPGIPGFTPSCTNGGVATIFTKHLFPKQVKGTFSITGAEVPDIACIKYDSTAPKRKADDHIFHSYLPMEGDVFAEGIVVPFNAVTINGSATLTISLNLNGIIEVYEGASGNENDPDDNDIYVLKKDFWDRLYISIN